VDLLLRSLLFGKAISFHSRDK